jgi:hypothetical protein
VFRPFHARCQLSRCKVLSPGLIFTVATTIMVPTYGLLAVTKVPSKMQKALTSHFIPICLCVGWLLALQTAAVETGCSIPQVIEHSISTWHGGVQSIAIMFKKTWFTLLCWVHLLMLDFLLAREVALDAGHRKVVAAHSVVLCFMCGPVGYLSHQLTKGMYALAAKGDVAGRSKVKAMA